MVYRNININVMIPTTAPLKPVKKGADVTFKDNHPSETVRLLE